MSNIYDLEVSNDPDVIENEGRLGNVSQLIVSPVNILGAIKTIAGQPGPDVLVSGSGGISIGAAGNTITISSTGPSGAAGGVLDGTYPNPGLAASVAGNGLTESSDVLSVNVDNSTIEISADTLQVKSGGITATQLDSSAKTLTLNYIIDGGGSAITTGVKGDLVIDFAATIISATLLADQTGAIVIDIWKDTYANYPPDNSDSITAAAPPTISGTDKSQDTTLTGWTTSIAAGDTFRFNVDSCTSITRVTLSLKIRRS